MNRLKRIVSFICALCLIVGFAPVQTYATEVEEVSIVTENTAAVQETLPSEVPAPEGKDIPAETSVSKEKMETTEVVEEEEESSFQAIPLYYQTDYPETSYGTGTVATKGSSITALAMVATYLTGHEYLPDELAQYFGDTAENNIRRLETASEALQLSFEKSENFDKTMEALRESKVAIAVMEAPSLFTTTQHFIVLTGLNEDGKIMVHDPYEPNYEKWDLKRAFAEGFAEGDILYGYCGAWIYDRSAIPEQPFQNSETETEQEDVLVTKEVPSDNEEMPVTDDEVTAAIEEVSTSDEEVPAATEDVSTTDESVPAVEEDTSDSDEEMVVIEETVPEEAVISEDAVRDVVRIPSLEDIAEKAVSKEGEETSETVFTEVPLYFQTDYPETMFGTGSVATSGCSITALAMVATYLTDHEYLPDELARYFGGTAENNIERLEIGSETMQLPFYKSENFDKTMAALREGKIAIALMEGSSLFTSTQHFIVLTGLNEDGTIMVHDPYEPNYERWDLKRAFAEGFDEGDILHGYSGAWIYDKRAMPEEPFLYSEPEPVRGEPRYPDIQLTLEEKQLLARVVWVEAQGESLEGQQAVAEVVLNRMASSDYADTLKGVIYAENQFRSVPYLEDAQPYQAQYEAIESAIYGPYVLPEDVMHFATYAVNGNVWGRIGGHIFCRG